MPLVDATRVLWSKTPNISLIKKKLPPKFLPITHPLMDKLSTLKWGQVVELQYPPMLAIVPCLLPDVGGLAKLGEG